MLLFFGEQKLNPFCMSQNCTSGIMQTWIFK